MTPETLTFEEASRILALPREVGRHPENDEPIYAQNGRYGPYITWGKETRSLESEEQIFTLDLDGAVALLAQPKPKGRRAAAGPLKELGEDPVTKRPVVVRNGKFGMYVTDGDTLETISLDRACELLAERRNADPSTRTRKAPAKKAAAKKAAKKPAKKAAKKAAKKTTKAASKKPAAKKADGATKRAATAAGKSANAALVARATSTDE
jgi:DNA topoisomerase I